MTDRPAYFVITRGELAREIPAIYWDELPKAPIRNLIYVVRLDTFPNGHKLLQASLAQLYATYVQLKERGKLPPRWEPPKPPPKTAPAAATGAPNAEQS